MPKLSIIIPVFNEVEHLHRFFDFLLAVEMPVSTEYVVVDDSSTDDSWRVIEEFGRREDFVVFQQPSNLGKGAALKKGIDLASGEVIAIQDADFEYDPTDLKKLVQPIVDDQADVVYGSRFRKSSHQVHRTMHYLGNRVLTLLSNLASGLYLSDMETCYKVFRSDVLKSLRLESNRFGFEPEVTAAIAKLKLRVHEYPITYHPRTYLEGKKIGWRDGLAAIWFILKYNFRSLPDDTRQRIPKRYLPTERFRLT